MWKLRSMAPDAAFFADGGTVYAVPAGAAGATALFSVPANDQLSLLPTANRITAALTPKSGCRSARKCLQLLSTPRAGGTPTSIIIEGTTRSAPLAETSGYAADQLLIRQPTDAGLTHVLTLSAATGAFNTLVPPAVWVGWVHRSGWRASGGELAAVLFCQPASGTSCAGASVQQRSLDGQSTVDLGTVPATLAYQLSWLLYDAMPNAVNISVSSLDSHLYAVTPGVAGSLRLIAGQP